MELGTMIAGRYRLDDRIAAGGMGEVWRGTDTRLNRAVAIKLLHSGLSGNDRFRARFHQEAQAVAALQSPGIVGLYDYGEEQSPEGLVSYLIMELVRGQALDKLLRQRGRLSPSETLKIMAGAADALEVAHRAHIIHRDIKPANLLVDPDGSVKIVDFGIASARGQAGLTETGTVMGTLAYASPEQLAGGDLTGATDIYSLGIVAYHCLSGRTPFNGNDPAAVITGHMTGQPAPLPPDIPGPVGQIVMRCLAKDPRQRFASAAELARVCRDGGMSGGTTAILSPPPSPATRPMTPGMAPAMAAGIAPAHTTVQPQATGQYGASTGQYGEGTPPERPLPPPREPEKPRRNPTGPILVVAAGIAVLIIALLLLGPWDDEGNPAADEGSTPDATSGAATTDAAEETSADDGGEDAQGDQNDSDGGDSEEDEESPEEPEVAEIPDVTGEELAKAVEKLHNKGFVNIDWQAQDPGLIAPAEDDICKVDSQEPVGDTGAEYDYSTPVTLYYWDDGAGCGM